MRIDGTNGVDPLGLGDTQPLSRQAKPADAGVSGQVDGGLEVRTSYEGYARLAAQSPDMDLQAVQEARRLLAQGELDTPNAILRAAAAMLDKGL